jgi:transposase
MDATTVGIDLAKNVFEIALADERGHIVERQRLTRARFERFFVNRPACRIVMEACGSAHHHARRLSSQGHEVCCPLSTPAPTSGATRPMRPMPPP